MQALRRLEAVGCGVIRASFADGVRSVLSGSIYYPSAMRSAATRMTPFSAGIPKPLFAMCLWVTRNSIVSRCAEGHSTDPNPGGSHFDTAIHSSCASV